MSRSRHPLSQSKSSIPGAPNPGVNQPTQSGTYRRVGRVGGGLEGISGSDEARVKPPVQPPRQNPKSKQHPAEERIPLPNRTRNRRGVSEFAILRSIDGQQYRFRKMSQSDHGDPIAHLNATILALVVALAEAAKGGNANSVLKSFGVSVQDADGQLFYDHKQASMYDADMTPDQVLEKSGFFRGEEDEDDYEGPGMGLPGVSFDGPDDGE